MDIMVKVVNNGKQDGTLGWLLVKLQTKDSLKIAKSQRGDLCLYFRNGEEQINISGGADSIEYHYPLFFTEASKKLLDSLEKAVFERLYAEENDILQQLKITFEETNISC